MWYTYFIAIDFNGCGMPAGNAYPSGHLVPSPFWDLLMLQLLRPNSTNLPCFYSTFHLEYPLVLSRFCFIYFNPFIELKQFMFRPQAFFKTMNVLYSHIFSSITDNRVKHILLFFRVSQWRYSAKPHRSRCASTLKSTVLAKNMEF